MTGKDERNNDKEMSYGKIMTSMLIPKDSRTNPKRILGGVAFLAFICFFLFAALSRSCQTQVQQQTGAQETVTRVWRG